MLMTEFNLDDCIAVPKGLPGILPRQERQGGRAVSKRRSINHNF